MVDTDWAPDPADVCVIASYLRHVTIPFPAEETPEEDIAVGVLWRAHALAAGGPMDALTVRERDLLCELCDREADTLQRLLDLPEPDGDSNAVRLVRMQQARRMAELREVAWKVRWS